MANKYLGNSLYKKTDRHFFNGYTGVKAGWGTNVMSGAALVGGAAWFGSGMTSNDPEVIKQRENRLEPAITTARRKSVQADYVGSAPVFQADGVANAPSLGATGSMVFGLHNMRKG